MNRLIDPLPKRIASNQAMPSGFLFYCMGPGRQQLALRLSAADSNAISISILDEELSARVQFLRIGRIVAVPSGMPGCRRFWWFPAQAVRDNSDEFLRADLVVAIDDHTYYRIRRPFETTAKHRTTCASHHLCRASMARSRR